MTDTLTAALYAKPGDLIKNHKGILYRVLKSKQVNYLVVDEDGTKWNLRKTFAYEVPDGVIFGGPAAEEAGVPTLRMTPPPVAFAVMHPGTVVFITRGRFASTTQKYVILRDNGETVSLTKLNAGDGGRYIRGLAKHGLEVTTAS